jgi:NADH-quinone oxidoreductase subunit C
MLATLDARLGERLAVPAEGMEDTIELVVRPSELTAVMRVLRDDGDLRFELLADLCGVDTGVTMQVVYHLWSPLSSDWVRVIADGLDRDDPRVPSITQLWPGAEWAEREAYDMFGIEFEGNRDLRRIYMPADYVAFPLRKDFAMPDDASRAPGEGIRHLELPVAPADVRERPVLRTSAGAGAVLAPGGGWLAVGAGAEAGRESGADDEEAARVEAGEEPA